MLAPLTSVPALQHSTKFSQLLKKGINLQFCHQKTDGAKYISTGKRAISVIN